MIDLGQLQISITVHDWHKQNVKFQVVNKNEIEITFWNCKLNSKELNDVKYQEINRNYSTTFQNMHLTRFKHVLKFRPEKI